MLIGRSWYRCAQQVDHRLGYVGAVNPAKNSCGIHAGFENTVCVSRSKHINVKKKGGNE